MGKLPITPNPTASGKSSSPSINSALKGPQNGGQVSGIQRPVSKSK